MPTPTVSSCRPSGKANLMGGSAVAGTHPEAVRSVIFQSEAWTNIANFLDPTGVIVAPGQMEHIPSPSRSSPQKTKKQRKCHKGTER